MNKILFSLLAVSTMSQVSFAMFPAEDMNFCNDSRGQTQLNLTSASLTPGFKTNYADAEGNFIKVVITKVTNISISSTVNSESDNITIATVKRTQEGNDVTVQLICTKQNLLR